MSGLIETDGFSSEERAQLAVIAGLMIPASDAYQVPAASDPSILAVICRLLQPQRAALRPALAELYDGMDEAQGLAWMAAAGPLGAVVTSAVAQAYYQDDRVLASIGLPAGPPFPQGYETPQGDWSLLDPVKQRAPFYRET